MSSTRDDKHTNFDGSDTLDIAALSIKDKTGLPSEVLDIIVDIIVQENDQPGILKHMLCSKGMYERLSGALYKDLKVDEKNEHRVFERLNHSLVSSDRSSYGSYSDRSKFGLDPLSIHQRKVILLNHVDHLTIVDVTAAKAIAEVLDPKYSFCPPWAEGPHPRSNHHVPKVFLNVNKLTFGSDMLDDCHTYRCTTAYFPEHKFDMEGMLHTLACLLHPRHFCGICPPGFAQFALDFDFADTFKPHFARWKLQTLSWHKYGGYCIWLPQHVSSIRLYFLDCSEKDSEHKQECTPCLDDLWFAIDQMKARPDITMELVNLLCVVEKKEEMDEKAAWAKEKLKVVSMEKAKPCECCGGK